ncbi:MAG: Ig-like domain-containing protein [Bacteroidales bacterium]|nr:Ig-like domain-containing protein [Bacteroidales bacterium]MCF8334151.1 Ig-like domain-containing protein [Bacteroidales bacterium]
MRNSRFYFLATLCLMIAAAMVFQACNKDDDKNNDPDAPTYTDGSGEIGEQGGTVMIDDEDSPIDRAKIEIPEGALESDVTITIEEDNQDVTIPGYDSPLVVRCEPEGTSFSKAVTLYLPYEGDADMAFYFDEEQGIIKQMDVLEKNTSKKLIKTETEHFSIFFAGEENVAMDLELVKHNNDFAAYGVLLDDIADIPPHWRVTQYDNAYDIAVGEPSDNVARFRFDLYKKLSFGLSEPVATKAYYVYWYEYTDLLRVDMSYNTTHQDATGHTQFFSKEISGDETKINTWMRGLPLILIFDEESFFDSDFEYDNDDEFFVGCRWGMNKPWNPVIASNRWTSEYSFGARSHAKKWSELDSFDEDSNQNGIIDSFESGSGENQPPNDPTNETPEDGATGVSVNTNLSWTCSDPDGDELNYDIYFGTSSNPSLAEEYYNSTSWDPGTLEANTTYYWQIKAFEVDNVDNYSESDVWEFTTADGGGSNTPPSASFTVSPSSGSTSTSFSFDASGSSDNEDPTSQLEVRWDFDGNGSWDTNWDTDKTENNQYSSEGTYTVKLEVRDTEGLTDQYTGSITVDNGGGGTTGSFTDPRDGQTYETVEIGSQVWFAENLNYETDNSWWYDNEPDNGDTYGRLYTYEAALNACPDGWHLPSDEEWKTLEMELGMSQSEADDTFYRGTDQGEQMKSTSGWNNNGNGTNSSGFSALPGGYRTTSGSFSDLGYFGYWWSYTHNISWYRGMSFNGDRVYRYYKFNNDYGFSVRCLKY